MSSANGGTYAGQYSCNGWVDDLKPTPSLEYASRFHLLSITVDNANAEQCAYGQISTRSFDATILVACASPLVSDKSVSEPCLIKKRENTYHGTTVQVRGINMPP